MTEGEPEVGTQSPRDVVAAVRHFHRAAFSSCNLRWQQQRRRSAAKLEALNP